MADSDLEAIRRARLQQLQQEGGQQGNSSSGGSGGQDDEQRSRESQARAHILSQILSPAAADRLGRIRMVNASRAEDVENRLIMLAQSGQLRGRVEEGQLKEILGAVSEQEQEREAGRVVVQRRKGGWDEDDLGDLLAED